MSEKIGFTPRLNFVLAKALYKVAEETTVEGDPRNPIIIEKGQQVEIKNWIQVVRKNSKIEDIEEGDVIFFTGRAIELNLNGEIYLLVKDEDMFGKED